MTTHRTSTPASASTSVLGSGSTSGPASASPASASASGSTPFLHAASLPTPSAAPPISLRAHSYLLRSRPLIPPGRPSLPHQPPFPHHSALPHHQPFPLEPAPPDALTPEAGHEQR